MLHRIYIEETPHTEAAIKAATRRYGIESYTVQTGVGVYKGVKEATTILEVFIDGDDENEGTYRVSEAAAFLQGYLGQESVLLVSTPCNGRLFQYRYLGR